MPADNLDSLIASVQKRVGLAPDYFLVQDWVLSSYRDISNRLFWTYRRKQGEFIFYAPYKTGLASIIRGESIANFSGGTVLTNDYVGRQLRIGGNDAPIRTIIGINSSTQAQLDAIWSVPNAVSLTFEIYQAYVTVPDDFDSFITVVDTQRNFQLDWWSHTASSIDAMDAKRAFSGNVAYWIVLKDYSSQRNGIVAGAISVRGVGTVPLSSGEYQGIADALFTVEMTSATVFKWKKDSGAYATGIAIDAADPGVPIALQDGVQVTFVVGATYTSGDIFVIRCVSGLTSGAARYEPWPHIKADEARPFLYNSRLPDITDPGTALPRYMRGDVIVELALAQAATWKDKGNLYYDLKLSMMHAGRAETMILDLEREDANREISDLTYDQWLNLPVYDSAYLAGHDIGYELNVLD